MGNLNNNKKLNSKENIQIITNEKIFEKSPQKNKKYSEKPFINGRKSTIDTNKIDEIDLKKNDIKNEKDQKICSRSKSDFAKNYLKKNTLENSIKEKKMKKELAKIRRNVTKQITVKKSLKLSKYFLKLDSDHPMKLELESSLHKIDKEDFSKTSIIKNYISDKESQLLSNRSYSPLEKSDNKKVNSNNNSKNNSIYASSTQIGSNLVRSSSNTIKLSNPLNQYENEAFQKNNKLNSTVKVVSNALVLNNVSERKSVVDVLTNKFREGNSNKKDKMNKQINSRTIFSKTNSIGSYNKNINDHC